MSFSHLYRVTHLVGNKVEFIQILGFHRLAGLYCTYL